MTARTWTALRMADPNSMTTTSGTNAPAAIVTVPQDSSSSSAPATGTSTTDTVAGSIPSNGHVGSAQTPPTASAPAAGNQVPHSGQALGPSNLQNYNVPSFPVPLVPPPAGFALPRNVTDEIFQDIIKEWLGLFKENRGRQGGSRLAWTEMSTVEWAAWKASSKIISLFAGAFDPGDAPTLAALKTIVSMILNVFPYDTIESKIYVTDFIFATYQHSTIVGDQTIIVVDQNIAKLAATLGHPIPAEGMSKRYPAFHLWTTSLFAIYHAIVFLETKHHLSKQCAAENEIMKTAIVSSETLKIEHQISEI